MNCPSCRHELELAATDCAACGLVLSKWKARLDLPKSAVVEPAGAIRPLATSLILLIVCAGGLYFARRSLMPASATLGASNITPISGWPPSVGQPYPDLKLMDEEGKTVSLSQFKGKVILLEP